MNWNLEELFSEIIYRFSKTPEMFPMIYKL